MAHALARGTFVLAAELPPPKGYDAASAIACAQRLKIRGVDVVTISDGPRGGARMSALSLAVLVQQQAGIEPVLQYACRDGTCWACSRTCSARTRSACATS